MSYIVDEVESENVYLYLGVVGPYLLFAAVFALWPENLLIPDSLPHLRPFLELH